MVTTAKIDIIELYNSIESILSQANTRYVAVSSVSPNCFAPDRLMKYC